MRNGDELHLPIRTFATTCHHGLLGLTAVVRSVAEKPVVGSQIAVADGPDRILTRWSDAAAHLHRTSRACTAQHYHRCNVRVADEAEARTIRLGLGRGRLTISARAVSSAIREQLRQSLRSRLGSLSSWADRLSSAAPFPRSSRECRVGSRRSELRRHKRRSA